LSGNTADAIRALAARGQAGSPVTDAAQGQLTDTLNGKYLGGASGNTLLGGGGGDTLGAGGNPYFQGAVNAATRPVLDAYSNTIMPGLDSQFSTGGRYGSGAHALGSAQNSNNLMNQVGDIGSQMSYQNYGDERAKQMQAMLFAPTMANQDYTDINAIGQAGEAQDAFTAQKRAADIARWNYNQGKDWNFTKDYIGSLGGAPPATQSTTTPQPKQNIFTGALGGAATGYGIGGAPGALLGGGLGLLGSLF
jgi:hypothetical protein